MMPPKTLLRIATPCLPGAATRFTLHYFESKTVITGTYHMLEEM